MHNKSVNFLYEVKQLCITLEVDAEIVPEFVSHDADGDPDGDPAYVDDMQIKVVDESDDNDDLDWAALKHVMIATPRPDLVWFENGPIKATSVGKGNAEVCIYPSRMNSAFLRVDRPMGLPQGAFYQYVDGQVCEVCSLYWLLEREALKQAGER